MHSVLYLTDHVLITTQSSQVSMKNKTNGIKVRTIPSVGQSKQIKKVFIQVRILEQGNLYNIRYAIS